MPLQQYGVVVGTLVRFERESPDNFGKYYHGYVYVNTPQGEYQAAVDVATPSGINVEYRLVRHLSHTLFAPVQGLADGFHLLASTPTSGALDYVRSRLLRGPRANLTTTMMQSLPFPMPRLPMPRSPIPRLPFPSPLPFPLPKPFPTFPRLPKWFSWEIPLWVPHVLPPILLPSPWVESDANNALTAMETLLTGSTRVYLFGERYTTGVGVHDVHLNQGDPNGSPFQRLDGIWQDGGVIAQAPNGTLNAFLVKFATQTLDTNAQGLPNS